MSGTELEGRTVLVTGAARGLGAAIARACHAHGADVVVTDVSRDDLEPLVDDMKQRARAMSLDVTDPVAWESVASSLRADGIPLDVLVNNAGIVRPAPIGQTSYADFRRSLDVNLGGAFLGIATFVRLREDLEISRPGSIINISSVRGLIGGTNAAGYCASKFGVRGLSKAAAVELGAAGIRVNTVCPGPIETDMSRGNPDFAHLDWDAYAGRIPLGSLGQPVDVAGAVVWLASDASAFVTGIDLPVDGGLTATSHTAEPRAGRKSS